jgi:hypothetical protein
MSDETVPKLLNAREAAAILRVSKETVCRYGREGKLHRVGLARRHYLEAEVLALLAPEAGR